MKSQILSKPVLNLKKTPPILAWSSVKKIRRWILGKSNKVDLVSKLSYDYFIKIYIY